jgi:hypothetical protein
VTEHEALHTKQGSAWQLLLEFLTPGGVAGQDTAVKLIAEAVAELEVQPAQRSRIEGAVVEALQKAVQRDLRDQHASPASIRVWISDLHPAQARSNVGAPSPGALARRGWGFFLLERQEDDSRTKGVQSQRLIELYLYQETPRVV